MVVMKVETDIIKNRSKSDRDRYVETFKSLICCERMDFSEQCHIQGEYYKEVILFYLSDFNLKVYSASCRNLIVFQPWHCDISQVLKFENEPLQNVT